MCHHTYHCGRPRRRISMLKSVSPRVKYILGHSQSLSSDNWRWCCCICSRGSTDKLVYVLVNSQSVLCLIFLIHYLGLSLSLGLSLDLGLGLGLSDWRWCGGVCSCGRSPERLGQQVRWKSDSAPVLGNSYLTL